MTELPNQPQDADLPPAEPAAEPAAEPVAEPVAPIQPPATPPQPRLRKALIKP